MNRRSKLIISICLALLFPTDALAILQSDQRSIIYDSIYYDESAGGCLQPSGPTQGLPESVPEPYRTIFPLAAAKHNAPAALVAAIFYAGEHASSWPDPPPPYGGGQPWASSSAGAQGPFQFLRSTWDGNDGAGPHGYGDDGDGDGDKDIQDLTDAAYGAAKYLAANGGTVGGAEGTPGKQPAEGPSIRNAIWHYNHANWYVERVFTAYQEFLGGAFSTTGSQGCGGLGIGASLTFPLQTTQAVIRGGADGAPGNGDEWCYAAATNCHGSYKAADIHAPTGTQVVAAVGGVVRWVRHNPLRMQIAGTDGLYYYYTHLKDGSQQVNAGDTVTAGQALGEVGDSEDAENTAPHLHFDADPVGNISVSRECVTKGSCVAEAQLKTDVQPRLVDAYSKLPEQ